MPGDAPKSDPCRDMESRDVTESMLFLQVHKMLRSSGSLVLLIDAAASTGTGRRAARWRASYGSALAISSLLSRSWHEHRALDRVEMLQWHCHRDDAPEVCSGKKRIDRGSWQGAVVAARMLRGSRTE